MPDRIPIGTIPGITSQLNGVDILVATLGVACTVTRVLVRQTDYDTGGSPSTACVGSIRNATAGGGSGIAFTIADQAQSAVVTGSLAVASGDSIYLRVSAGSVGMNLTGWIEVEGSAAITTALTNLTRVKEYLGITGSGSDSILTNLINAVSDEIQGAVGRTIIQATATAERIDSAGFTTLPVRHRPIISIASLTEGGEALVENTDYECKAADKASGILVRISSGDVISWARGTGNVLVTYDHGYASVPEAVVQAATELVAFDYLQSQPGGKRIGLGSSVLPAGGEGAYTTREALWRAQRTRLRAVTSAWL